MKISQDRYELPLAAADSAAELARMCGVSVGTIYERNSRTGAGKRRDRSYEHSKTAVQNFFHAAACAFHFPNKSLCVPVRVSVSINKSSSMR